MWKTKRHVFARKVAVPLFIRPFYFLKNHFHSKIYKLPGDTPYIIISNHQTTDDPVLLLCAVKNISYPVTSRDFIPVKIRKFVYRYLGPILKSKNLKDVTTVKQMFQVLKEGNSLMLYPEGNRTFSGELCYIHDSTIKFIRKAKVNLAIYNFHGGYGYDPRYSSSKRKGKFYGEMRKIYLADEIAKMTDEELKDAVIGNLTVKEAPSEYAYKSNERAEKLERTLYLCPVCGTLNNIESKGNFIKCNACKCEAEYTEHLTFKSNDPRFKINTVGEWFRLQENYVRNYKAKPGEIIYEDDFIVFDKIDEYSETNIGSGKIIMSDTYIEVAGQRYDFEDIAEMTVSGKQRLIFYIAGSSLRVSSTFVGFNAVKYMQMFYHLAKETDDFLGI